MGGCQNVKGIEQNDGRGRQAHGEKSDREGENMYIVI